MDPTGIQFLQLMFKPGETICVSPNKYAYHCIRLEDAWKDEVTLVPPDSTRGNLTVPSSHLVLVALNPILGFRNDHSCYRYRNFLLELDMGELKSQVDYIRRVGIPYSAMIFSGNKSIHTLISLDEDLPSESLWRLFAQWMLNILSLADQATKNPSRGIRIPGGLRDGVVRQRLVEQRGPVTLEELAGFLNRFEHARPKIREKRKPASRANIKLLDRWVVKQLSEGIDFSVGRNRAWYSIACSFALSGYTEENTIAILSEHFKEETTFKEREWLTTIHSAFQKHGG